MREANAEKEKLTKGMVADSDRPCSDKICCLIFLVFIVAIAGVSFYAYGKGDPERILTPFDSDGNACGQKDQCSIDMYDWPQGKPCPEAGADGFSDFTIPADAKRHPGKKVKIPKARDFTDYPLKYFTLSNNLNLF